MSLARWSLVAVCLPACLVSFEDYPVGVLEEGGAGRSELPTAGGSSAAAPATEGGVPAEAGEPPTSAEVSLVDDFERVDTTLLELEGRQGDWYVSNDGRGLQTPRAGGELLPSPVEPPRGGSTQALHTFGGPFFTWGALVGVSLSSGEGYDLSGYRGIRLWVRAGGAPGSARQVRLNLTTAATTLGGPCVVCNDHFGADIALTAQWAQVDLPLSALAQSGFGQPQLDPDWTAVIDLQLTFPANVSFDLWVDDIELYR